jgi:hypothetical protein
MQHARVLDEPKIDGDAVVMRVLHEDPAQEDSGRIFVCRLTGFDDMTIETFPVGRTPGSDGRYRAEAAAAAKRYVETHVEQLEELFEELARRRAND